MNTRFPLLAATCALALVACSNKPSGTEEATAPASAATTAAPVAEPAANPAPGETAAPTPATAESASMPAPATAAPAGEKAAVVADCATEIAGTDAMQYDVNSITVPASCSNFKITLKHAGKMPVAAMGHNVVISKQADMPAITADGVTAGAANNYVKPDDARVIAHTKLVGGGETTSVSFAVSKIKADGPYEFFCSFPGHSAMMKGSIAVK